ncbi:MAG: tRNA pseudouridine(38-40) synthase TruA, partial [Rickettsiales bacterium]|nr:tRNA pseudouridine(38-40) synthase TruA [Rickettsiales bacterium]
MSRYKITIEYDGTNLIGWQTNAGGDSVQSLLEDAIFKFSGEKANVYGVGRTDAGVHALAMVAHFDLEREADSNTVMRAVNFYLKEKPVVILKCEDVDDEFHARFSCQRRNYRYIILNRKAPAVLDKDGTWWVPYDLDVDKMEAAAAK